MAEPTRGAGRRASAGTIAEVRRLVETTTLTQAEIGRRLGLHDTSVSRMVRREGWHRPSDATARRELVGSIREKVDAEIAEVERILDDASAAAPSAAERARTLASLVRTLRELARYDEDQLRAAGRQAGANGSEDEAVADLDQLREELARRLESLRQNREDE